MRSALSISLACLFAFVLAQPHAHAKIGFRQLTSTFPVAVQRGQSTRVEVRTNFTLNGVHGVFFDRPGLTMTCLESEPVDAPRKGRGSKGTPFTFLVDAPTSQSTGVYEFREVRMAEDPEQDPLFRPEGRQ